MGSPLQQFPRTYTATDFNYTASTSLTASKWNKLGYVTVPAQQQVGFGSGIIANGVDSRRKVYLQFQTSGNIEVVGVVRLAIANANETDIRVVMEERTENLKSGVLLAETRLKAKQDSKLIVYFNPDASASVVPTGALGGTASQFLMPVTVYQ